jgi:hypothetical protein
MTDFQQRLKPATGVAPSRQPPQQNVADSNTGGEITFFLNRMYSMSKDALAAVFAASRLGEAALESRPIAEFDNMLRLTQALVRFGAGIGSSEKEYDEMRKSTELVSSWGIAALLGNKLISSLAGKYDIDLENAKIEAEFLNASASAARGIGTLSKPIDPETQQVLELTRRIIAVQKIISVLGSGKKTATNSFREGSPDRIEPLIDETTFGDFPNHIPKATGDGTMLA